jgi:hypothetical protein
MEQPFIQKAKKKRGGESKAAEVVGAIKSTLRVRLSRVKPCTTLKRPQSSCYCSEISFYSTITSTDSKH